MSLFSTSSLLPSLFITNFVFTEFDFCFFYYRYVCWRSQCASINEYYILCSLNWILEGGEKKLFSSRYLGLVIEYFASQVSDSDEKNLGKLCFTIFNRIALKNRAYWGRLPKLLRNCYKWMVWYPWMVSEMSENE